jgi:glycosyltransferase involved in cell wall biosynthesis
MKILYLNNYFYLRGGSEKILFEEMRMMLAATHNVAVFARAHECNVATKYSKHFPHPIETESIKASPAAFHIVKELIYSRSARTGLMNVLADYRPDVAHAHNTYGRLTVSVLDELNAQGIPVVLTLHDLKLLCPSYLMLNHGKVCELCKGNLYYHAILTKCLKDSYAASAVYALESWINHTFGKYDSVKLFISPSRFLREKMIEYGWSPDRIAHVPNFIDVKSVGDSRHVGSYNLYFGRLSREKGVKTLLKAYEGLNGKIPLLVVGDGPERDNLEKIAGDLSLPVRFTGYLSGDALHEAIANARAAILPSEMYENAPLSLLEAFAHGKPVIGARIGGIPEMIEEGVNGLLFESGNVEDLREKLVLMANMTDQEIMSMGRSAREKVEKEYSAVAHYEKLMEVYSRAQGKPCA